MKKQTVEVPDLKKEQIGHELASIPQEYWRLACCIYRDKCHTRFTCSTLPIPQRILFAYRYYLYKMAISSVLANSTSRSERPSKEKLCNLARSRIKVRGRHMDQSGRGVQVLTSRDNKEEQPPTTHEGSGRMAPFSPLKQETS